MYDYEATIEGRSGLFNLRRRSEPAGKIKAGQPTKLTVGGGSVDLSLDEDGVLLIDTRGKPVIAEFAAEPQRYLPQVVVKLDEREPVIATGRRRVSLYEESDPHHRLVLMAPVFRPLLVPKQSVKEYADFIDKTDGKVEFIQ